jgi:hypothetical protein
MLEATTINATFGSPICPNLPDWHRRSRGVHRNIETMDKIATFRRE